MIKSGIHTKLSLQIITVNLTATEIKSINNNLLHEHCKGFDFFMRFFFFIAS